MKTVFRAEIDEKVREVVILTLGGIELNDASDMAVRVVYGYKSVLKREIFSTKNMFKTYSQYSVDGMNGFIFKLSDHVTI